MKRIKSPVIRERMKKEILHAHPEKSYWNSIRVSTVRSRKNAWMEGKSIADIAALEGEEPVDMLFRILIGEKLRVGAIFLSMREENLRKFLSLPCVMIGTDSSARSFSGPTFRGKPHPRGFGSFPVGDPRRRALHGGVVSSLIDTTGGAAAWAARGPEESARRWTCGSTSWSPRGSPGRCGPTARLLRKGNRVCHVRVSVTQDGVLVAEGSAVYSIHRGGPGP